ncbi:DUF4157 domain-containing protein [Algoriphagus aestuarii]|nr:DUF4157 domain-containing protein [Algoriphagus aestuarii]
MNTHFNKNQENKTQSVSADSPQKQSGDESTFQFVDNRPEAIAQRKLQDIANNGSQAKHVAHLKAMSDNYSTEQLLPVQKKENKTGLPDKLKSGIENLSGFSMDDIKVHYNSTKPAQLQAHAYAQGTDVHIASGQEKHLPHEAWHVVQQKQGRVKPTVQLKHKVNVNDDAGLEKEADDMGEKAQNVQLHQTPRDPLSILKQNDPNQSEAVSQLKPIRVAVTGITHVVKVVNESIFEGQEVPPPFGQVQNNEELFIDDDDIFTSRRGPNQEVEDNRGSDAERNPDRDWYKVLKLKNEKVEAKDYYIREGTFTAINGPEMDENLDSVEDLVYLMEHVLPGWANIHRAMAIEAEEFYELQEAQKPKNPKEQRKTVHLYGNDIDSTRIADLSNIKTGGEKDLSLHLGSAKMETYEREDFLRVYLSMVSPQTAQKDVETNHRYTTYKDAHQDETGEILIYGTQKSGSPDKRRAQGSSNHDTMFFNIGKPLRAYAWAKKYQAQHPDFAMPVVRSFLTPLRPTLEIMFGASTEHDSSAGAQNFRNVDMDRLGNQFSAGGSELSALEKLAVGGSMITYSDDVSPFDKFSGKVLSLSALAEETGVPDKVLKSALLTDEKSFRSTFIGRNITEVEKNKLDDPNFMGTAPPKKRAEIAKSIANKAMEGAVKKRPSSMVADELQVVYACWKGNKVLLPTGATLPDNRQEVVREFLNKEGYSTELIDQFIQEKM